LGSCNPNLVSSEEFACCIYPKVSFSETFTSENEILIIKELWRPIFIIVYFVIVLWRELNCVKIPQGEANKSANRWGNLRAKGGVVPSSVFNLPHSCEHQIQFFTLLYAYYYISIEQLYMFNMDFYI
jgi:hypothetical protein